MFKKYFGELEQQLLKNAPAAQKGDKAASKKGKKTAAAAKAEKVTSASPLELMKSFEKIIPSRLSIGQLKLIDASGYSPEGIDFLIYKELCRDMVNVMEGYVPAELVYGCFHLCPVLNKENLGNVLNGVIQAKKINRYTEKEAATPLIPSFVVCYSMDFNFPDLKNAILDYYISRGIDNSFEFDVMIIINRGMIIKNWRDKRNFIALETGKDTMMWSFILMNEYFDVNKGDDLDIREYVKYTEKYNEY